MRTHTGFKPYRCTWPGCTYASSGSGHLTRHYRVHTVRPCTTRPFSFAPSDALRLPQGEKPYKCTWEGCNYAATQSGHLTAHIRKHTGDRPFKCPVEGCGYAASRSWHLSRHMARHPDQPQKTPQVRKDGKPATKRGRPARRQPAPQPQPQLPASAWGGEAAAAGAAAAALEPGNVDGASSGGGARAAVRFLPPRVCFSLTSCASRAYCCGGQVDPLSALASAQASAVLQAAAGQQQRLGQGSPALAALGSLGSPTLSALGGPGSPALAALGGGLIPPLQLGSGPATQLAMGGECSTAPVGLGCDCCRGSDGRSLLRTAAGLYLPGVNQDIPPGSAPMAGMAAGLGLGPSPMTGLVRPNALLKPACQSRVEAIQ